MLLALQLTSILNSAISFFCSRQSAPGHLCNAP